MNHKRYLIKSEGAPLIDSRNSQKNSYHWLGGPLRIDLIKPKQGIPDQKVPLTELENEYSSISDLVESNLHIRTTQHMTVLHWN